MLKLGHIAQAPTTEAPNAVEARPGAQCTVSGSITGSARQQSPKLITCPTGRDGRARPTNLRL